MNELVPLVFIVILNYNGWEDTLECLDSLKSLNYQNFSILVVDNASTNNSVAMIRERHPEVKILESKFNRGYAAGNNIGIQEALQRGAEYVWLLNNDTEVDPQALTKLIERMQRTPSIGMCGSKLVYYHKRDILQALGGATYNKWWGISRHLGEGLSIHQPYSANDVEAKLDYIVGASLLVSRSFLERIGLMNEDYFLFYEEIDWATRARGMFRLGYAPESIVYHKEGASVGTTKSHMTKEKRLRSEYYSLRSRLLFTRRYFPRALPTTYLGILIIFVVRISRGQWDRVKNLSEVLWLLMQDKSPI